MFFFVVGKTRITSIDNKSSPPCNEVVFCHAYSECRRWHNALLAKADKSTFNFIKDMKCYRLMLGKVLQSQQEIMLCLKPEN